MALSDQLQKAWYEGQRPPWWALPLASLYGALAARRRRRFRSGRLASVWLPVPVVVVGNITVGGTGKTPLTMALVEALAARGWRPGVVSRGYGGRQRDPVLLGDAPDPAQFGDEPCLIRAAGVPVAVGRDRPSAAALLVEAGCSVVIADDGLQHYRLARDVEICVIDGARRFGNGRLLPAGPLREPLSRLDQVDFRVCNGVPMAGEYAMQLVGGAALALLGGERRALSAFAGQSVDAVAAIGHPERFFESLRAQGLEVTGHPFPDHHAFAAGDFVFASDKPVLMTDKDAIKCQRFAREGWWRVPVRATLPAAFVDALCERIRAAADRSGGRAAS